MTERIRPPAAGEVEISRPDKVLWPEPGVTKAIYAAYLQAVAPRMLPWLERRPLTMIRAPDGITGERYFQKAAPKYAPAWIETVTIPAPSAKRDVPYVICDHEATLRWLANQAVLEFHPAPVTAERLDRPDLLVVDIDPPDDGFAMAVEVARLVLEVLEELSLPAGVKTTGGDGLHIWAPIERRYDAQQLRASASELTRIVAEREPDLVTAAFRKDERGGRVLLDPSRNSPGATVVSPYSPRTRPGATVSFPLVPAQLSESTPADFTIATAPALLDGEGPRAWDALVGSRRRLPSRLLVDTPAFSPRAGRAKRAP